MATETTQKATVGKSYRVAIQTKYHGDTGRISAWHGDSKKIYVAWNGEQDVADNHAKAIQAYLDHMNWDGQWQIGSIPNGTGYVAVWVGNQ